MATIATDTLTLADWSKRLDPEGRVPDIVELLSQTNEVLTDMLWLEGNLPTGHRTVVRTGLPDVAWRKLNYGVPQSKSKTAQVDEACGMLEAFGQVDKDLAELNGNTSSFRMSENMAFLESMNQSQAQTLFYGDTSINPERFLGLSARYSDSTAANGENIIKAGGASTDNASVWLICWGRNTVHGIFPKGSRAGLIHEDLGLDTVSDDAGNKYRAYQDRYQWKCGLSLRDWRYAVRIANIDISDLSAITGTQSLTAGTNIIKTMIKAIHRIPSMGMGRPVFYVNRTVRQYLDIMALDKSTSALSISESAGQFKTNFLGIPIRTCDALLNNETVVS